jgi:predicted ATPase/DNA-binding CsgD family transcriptional regulator
MDSEGTLLEPLTKREVEILHLLAEGCSNREIAQKLVISLETVKWYNKQIYSKLDAHSREQAVAKARQAGLLPAAPSAVEHPSQQVKHNLPIQITSFIGRQGEIKTLNSLLAAVRLLTLRGPPGTGKTRLAVETVKQCLDRFPDGVFYIDLAPITDPDLVLSTIVQSLDLKESQSQSLMETLIRHLRDKQVLLVLDNFEQVIPAAPLTSDLLSACPGLKIMVTSREALRVSGEQEYPVPPLAVPDAERLDSLRELSQNEAVQLFIQRTRAVKPDFELSEGNAPFVAEICIRLDGLPLAIELAAARSNLLSPENMCARLESRLTTLTGGARDLPRRMQTLRAAIDWSYNLLDNQEQRLLNQLSVFQGGRAIEAVEKICDPDVSISVLDGLESLLNKNLLYSEPGKTGETRFYMLETIHEYAREMLAKSGEKNEYEKRHAQYFVALAEQSETEFQGIRQEYWYARLTDELDNIRTVLNWAFANQDYELAARLAAAMREFWYYNGVLSESSTWIDRALENEGQISPAVRAKTLNASSRIAFASGDHAVGERLARQALTLAGEIDDQENYAWACLILASHLMFFADKIKEATRYTEEGLQVFQELDRKFGICYGLNLLGEFARIEDDYPLANRLYQECYRLSRETGNKMLEVVSLANLSYVAHYQDDFDQSIDYCRKALVIEVSLQMDYACAITLAQIAGPICALGDPDRAARLLAASEAQLNRMGAHIQPGDKHEVERFKRAIKQQLSEAEFSAAWAEGESLTMDQALAEAQGEAESN